jgi:antitoxin component YwqK of YwqJK toxin-antitoxin module
MNHPNQHFAMNEAWILSDSGSDLTFPAEGTIKKYQQKYPDGQIMAQWSAKITPDGRYLLHGKETWYFTNNKQHWQANYENGKKIGWEYFWAPGGEKLWVWLHRKNGASTWSQYWPNGVRKLKSTWKNSKCQGVSTIWDMNNDVISHKKFLDGQIVKDYLKPAVDARKE